MRSCIDIGVSLTGVGVAVVVFGDVGHGCFLSDVSEAC
jgi:hypothetical protein